MKTLNLQEAAAFLHMHPEEVRTRTKRGLIPGGKTGRRYVFLDEDLAEFVRSRYSRPRQALQVTTDKETVCHYANAAGPGGLTSSRQVDSEYANLLGLPIEASRKSSTTN